MTTTGVPTSAGSSARRCSCSRPSAGSWSSPAALIGGPTTALVFLVHRGRHQHGRLVVQRQDRHRRRAGQAGLRGGGPAPLRDGPRPDHARGTADAEALRDPAGAAERLRHRPQPEAFGRRGDGGHPQAALRGRAARRSRARARPRPQPRHPADLGRLGDRLGDHLDRLHAALVRRRRRLAPRGRSARIALVLLAPTRGRRSSRWRSRASASTRRTPLARRSAATRSRSPRRCCASRPGAQAIPMQVNQATRAALHRQAVQRRGHRLALLDASADRGAGPPAPPDAADRIG